jgi:predicted acylesterase/phospholipase RssA
MRDLGLTLAGGGNRSFYQQALLETWGERLWDRVAALASVSAGAAIATLLLSGRAPQARVHWDGLRRGITKNLDVSRALRGERIAPHGRIYHSTLVHALSEGGLARLQATPFPVFVLCSLPPARVPTAVATWLGLGAYALEKRLAPRLLHPRAGQRLGFREFVFDARACQSPVELADLVLASSSTPPFTPVGNFRGARLLDGGLVDNVPASLVERVPGVRKNLVLLTRPYPSGVAGVHGERLYLEPSAPIPIERWDYTESAPVDATLALGRHDAQRYGRALEEWLERAPELSVAPSPAE